MCQNVCVTCVCFPNVLLRRAQFYSPALRCAVRSIVQPPAQFLGPRAAEQPVLQRLETLQKVCALVAFSTAYIHTIIQPPPSLRSIVRIIALCPARRGSIVRSTAQCPSRFCHPNSRKCSAKIFHVCQEIHVGIGLTRRDTKCQNPPRHLCAQPQSRGAPRPFRPAV